MMRVSVDTVLGSKTLRLTGSTTPLHRSASCISPGATAPMTTPSFYSTDPMASLGGIFCLRDLLDPRPASFLKSKFMGLKLDHKLLVTCISLCILQMILGLGVSQGPWHP